MNQQYRSTTQSGVTQHPHAAVSRNGDVLLTIPQEDAVVATLNAIEHHAALVTITAESGAGKTVVADAIADGLRERGMAAVRVRRPPRPTRMALLAQLAASLEIDPNLLARAPDPAAARLVGNARPGLPLAFILDDADFWPLEAVQSFALLTGGRPAGEQGRGSLHAILLGSAQLRAQIQASARDALFLTIPPLTLRQAREYIARRFAMHGGIRRRMSLLAVDEVLLRAGGNPRRIDHLTDDCLALAGVERGRLVTPATVHFATRAARLALFVRLRGAMPVLLAGAAGTALAVAGLVLGLGGPSRVNSPAPGAGLIGTLSPPAIQAPADSVPAAPPSSPLDASSQGAAPSNGTGTPSPIPTPSVGDQALTSPSIPRADPFATPISPVTTLPVPDGSGSNAPALAALPLPPGMMAMSALSLVAAPGAASVTAPVPRPIGSRIELAIPDVAPARIPPMPASPDIQVLAASNADPRSSIEQPTEGSVGDVSPPPLPPARLSSRQARGYDGPVLMHRAVGGETMSRLLVRIFGRNDAAAQALFRTLNPGIDSPGPWPRGVVVAVPVGLRRNRSSQPRLAPEPGPEARDNPVGETRSSLPYFCRSISPQNSAENDYTRQVCGR